MTLNTQFYANQLLSLSAGLYNSKASSKPAGLASLSGSGGRSADPGLAASSAMRTRLQGQQTSADTAIEGLGVIRSALGRAKEIGAEMGAPGADKAALLKEYRDIQTFFADVAEEMKPLAGEFKDDFMNRKIYAIVKDAVSLSAKALSDGDSAPPDAAAAGFEAADLGVRKNLTSLKAISSKVSRASLAMDAAENRVSPYLATIKGESQASSPGQISSLLSSAYPAHRQSPRSFLSQA